jgi:hypothetical protein
MSEAYPGDAARTPDPNPIPLTLCTPTWLGATLTLVKQQITPAGPFLDLLNSFSLEQLEEERAKLREQMTQWNTAAELLDLAISARKAANGARQDETVSVPGATATATAPPPRIGAKPPLKKAILAVMAGGGRNYEWSPTEIHAALDEHGWAPQTDSARSQISNRLRDLVKSGQLRKPRPGRYYLMRGD